jgi:hypothetical protein
MKKFSLFVISVFLISNSILSQMSFGGGYTHYKSLSSVVRWQGIQAFVEIPNNEYSTMFARISYMLPQRFSDTAYATAYSLATSPQQIQIDRLRKSSFLSIEGGRRTYFINTYDAGIAPYVSSNGRAIIGTYSETYSDYDQSKYDAPNAFGTQTSILIAIGGNLGVKYQLPYRGAITLDVGAEYVMTLFDPAQFMGNEVTPISLFLNLSYRFDWY